MSPRQRLSHVSSVHQVNLAPVRVQDAADNNSFLSRLLSAKLKSDGTSSLSIYLALFELNPHSSYLFPSPYTLR